VRRPSVIVFDTETRDFLMCGRCGVHVGGQMEEAGRYYAIANLRMPRGHHFARPILSLGIGSCREKLVRTYTAVLKS
jgi:hypothetical protein